MRHHALPLVLLLLWPSTASATSVAVAAPAASEGVPSGLVGAVAEIARQVVADADGLELVGAADLSIGDLQLARGCVGDTPECLGPLAEDLSADVLLIPRIDAAGQYVLTLVTYRATSRDVARVVRRGDEETLVSGLDAQVREALGLPPVEEVDQDVDEDADDGSDDDAAGAAADDVDVGPEQPPPERARGTSVGPWIVAGVGVAALGVGVALGAASSGAQSEYEATVVRSTADADTARDAYDRASGLALGANILFAAGGALALGGIIWLVADLLGGDDGEEAPVAVAPAASPGAFAILVEGQM